MPQRSLRLVAAIAGIALAQAAAAQATYPDRVVRFIVPFSSGGVTDVVSRPLAQKLGAMWGHQVVVENRPGAGSTIGAEVVARAKPDGYTLLLSGSTHLVGAALHAGRLSFDPLNDFTDIGLVAEQANVLVVHPSLAANNLAELLALARSEPKKLNYASSGNGSSQHLFGALLFSMTGVALTHVPYKGSGPAMADLLSGLVPVSVPAISNAIGHIQAGKLRALGVTSLKRSPALPNVPSLDELGVKGYDATLWFALMGPKGLPREIVNKIWESLVIALGSPEVAKPYAQQGVDVRMMPPAEFSAFNRVEAAKWARIVKVSGATVD